MWWVLGFAGGAPAPHFVTKLQTSKELNQAFADSAEEVFAFGAGLFENLGLIAVFEGDFLQKKFDGIFGLEALSTEFADACGEASGVGGDQSRVMIGAGVLAELAQSQAVKGSLGFRRGKQRGDGIGPVALRAGPSLEAGFGDPDDGSGLFRFFAFLVHERRGPTQNLPMSWLGE